MKTQLFIEGRNGGRAAKRDLNAPWRALDFEGDEPLPPITVATEHGAVVVSVDPCGTSVTVELKRWKLSDDGPTAGVDRLIYSGPIDG